VGCKSDFDFVELTDDSTKRTLEIDGEIQWNHHCMFYMLRFSLQCQGSQVDKASLKCCPFKIFISS
jgi:hypothetical protein